MPQRHLGLFDTPPSQREIRLGLAIVGLQFVAAILLYPLRDIRLGPVNAFIPVIDVAMCIGELIVGTLFCAQAAIFRSRALTVLGAGYVLSALFLIPHALTFPGAFSTTGLLGADVNTTAWLAVFWRWTSPIAIILYALLKGADSAAPSEAQRRPVPVLGGVLGAMAIAVLMTLLATVGHDWLPPLFLDSTNAVFSRLAFMKCITVTLTIAAMVLVFRQTRSVLDMWLLVTMFGWMVQAALNISLRERFTLGFYHFYGLTLFSNVIIMLALVVESSRLYARLALSVAATDRERDARLMSMDTLTAAIAHEVGQPLTAVTLNAMGGIKWLSRSPPNSAKAIQSLQATLEAARRTSDVIKSVRATSSRGAGTISEFNVNDLVRETAGLLGRELAAQNISLLLALDESLPPIRANRVQIQRVIINLLSNAIDALTVTRRRVRCISIRSALFEGQGVQLDVSDSGVGIEPRDMARIFEPFFTTKSKGTGLGLSLSRTIIEDHGGRLWASASDDSSATLHLQLPGFPSPTG